MRFPLTIMSIFHRFKLIERIVQLTQACDCHIYPSRWTYITSYAEGLFIIIFLVNYFTYMAEDYYFDYCPATEQGDRRLLFRFGARA